MIKTISKYFSVLLILILVNSNFSFAFSQMLCEMSIEPTVCKCEENNMSDEVPADVSKMSCCDNNILEINNSNTLVKNNTDYTNLNSIQLLISLLPHIEITKTFADHLVFQKHHKPPSDIPILISSFLI